eukprot:2351891-Rhodomonas_salina.3
MQDCAWKDTPCQVRRRLDCGLWLSVVLEQPSAAWFSSQRPRCSRRLMHAWCAGTSCKPCGKLGDSSSRYIMLGVLVVLLLTAWYYVTWQPYFAVLEPEDELHMTCCQ